VFQLVLQDAQDPPAGGAQGANLLVFLAVPVHEGALGDLEAFGDAGEAPTFGAEFEELTLRVGVIPLPSG
jgi:hypothetical protein